MARGSSKKHKSRPCVAVSDPVLMRIQEIVVNSDLTRLVWPRFLVDPSDLAEPALSFEISIEEFNRRYLHWGIRRQIDQKLVAYASSALIQIELGSDSLPDAGWRFAIEASLRHETPNSLCMLVANVAPDAQGEKLSGPLLEMGKLRTKQSGFTTMVAPVRPKRGDGLLDIPLNEYVAKINERGEPVDPWLRQHVRAGAAVLNICAHSVVIQASRKKWEEWLGRSIDSDKLSSIPGGLAPLSYHAESEVGTYIEPNIWVRYDF